MAAARKKAAKPTKLGSKSEAPPKKHTGRSRVPAPDYSSLTQREIAAAFGVSQQAVSTWRDCPRGIDGGYNLPDVIAYREQRIRDSVSNIDTLKAEKLTVEIQRLEAQVQKINEQTIERSEHERILIERGTAWRQLWERAVVTHVNDFVMQPREALLVMFERFGRTVSHAFVGCDDE